MVGKGTAVLVAAALGIGLTAARGDVVRFAAGGQVEAKVEERGGRLEVETPGGTWGFGPTEIRSRAVLPLPSEEWPGRAAKAREGGAEGRFRAGWWALEHGLTGEAVEILREAHAADPAHEPTGRMVAALGRLAAPRPDPDLEALGRALGGRFEVARGPHVVLLHQHEGAEAAARVELLERVATTFYLAFAAWGVELPVPAERLPSAWYASQEDYLAFLHREGADAFRSTRGYYHPTRRAVVAFDARRGEPQRPAREAAEQAREALARRPGSARARGELARREVLFDLEWRAVDVATATHEMVHQLVDASGLSPGPGAFPVWLQEGLAMQFEVVRGGRWAGLGRANDFRLPFWRTLAPPSRLESVVRDAGFGRGYQPGRYAEAWALVYFLRKDHPREFLAYLDLLRVPDPERRPGRGPAAFRDAFGPDLEALEAAWRARIGEVRTPAEEAGEPSPGGPALDASGEGP